MDSKAPPVLTNPKRHVPEWQVAAPPTTVWAQPRMFVKVVPAQHYHEDIEGLRQMEAQRDHWLEIAREKDAEILRLRHGLDTVLRRSDQNSRVHEIAYETLQGRTHEPSAEDVLCAGVVRSNPQTRQIHLAFETDEQFQAAKRLLGMSDSPQKSGADDGYGNARSATANAALTCDGSCRYDNYGRLDRDPNCSTHGRSPQRTNEK